MPTRKFRRSIDHRTASLAREMATLAATDERLRNALTGLALSACSVSVDTQALVAACKSTSDLFGEVLKSRGSSVAEKSQEVFGRLAQNVLESGNGVFMETLEVLVAIAAEALPPDNRLRTLSNLAVSSGLDDSQIALDWQEQSVEQESERPKEPPAPIESIDYTANHLNAFAEIALTRGFRDVRIDVDGSVRYLTGTSGRGWHRITHLRCDETEALRVAEGVRNRVRSRSAA